MHLINKFLNPLGLRIYRESPPSSVEHNGISFHYELIRQYRYAPWAGDVEFNGIFEKVREHTLIDKYRAYELYDIVRQLASIEGDVIEVGVWRGGSAALISAAAAQYRPQSVIHLCDTFLGVPKAGVNDSRYVGGEHDDAQKSDVDSLLEKLALTNARVHVGIFPDKTGASLQGLRFAFAHIDVDVFQSAADCIAWLSPRMSPGGVLVLDDFGFKGCDGVTRAASTKVLAKDWLRTYNLNGHAILHRKP